jgi:pilus assembly protein CpaD
MTRYGYLPAMVLALAACAPGAAEYTKAEAPDRLQVVGATSTVDLAFISGSDHLAGFSARRLDQLVAAGAIRPADRVTVAAAGSPGLAAARESAIARELLRWGIVAEAQPASAIAPNRGFVIVGRYAVGLPPCPNWSETRPNDFTNALPSYFGCADAVNLGLMVASPADLAGGRQLALADGKPAAAAVDRYLNDQVQAPNLVSLGSIGLLPPAPPPAAPSAGGGS